MERGVEMDSSSKIENDEYIVEGISERGRFKRGFLSFAEKAAPRITVHKHENDILRDKKYVHIRDLPRHRGGQYEYRKDQWDILEGRVWAIFYRMGFPLLSSPRGGAYILAQNTGHKIAQADVVAVDGDTLVFVECKSSKRFSKNEDLNEIIHKSTRTSGMIVDVINSNRLSSGEQLITNTFNILVAPTARKFNNEEQEKIAKENRVLLWGEDDLSYFEKLAKSNGTTARTNLFVDLFRKMPVKSSEESYFSVEAIKTKANGKDVYQFSVAPKEILDIHYVSHRRNEHETEVTGYQRMVKPNKIKDIKNYISENNNAFLPSVLISINGAEGETVFEPLDETGSVGVLKIRRTRGSAWVIDGQHRLLAYHEHEKASTDRISITAFVDMEPGEQSNLFQTINSRQLSPSPSIIKEGYGELLDKSTVVAEQIMSIVSNALSEMINKNKEYPLYRKIKTEYNKPEVGSQTYSTIWDAIISDKNKFFIEAENKKTKYKVYGPLWVGDKKKTEGRTAFIIGGWIQNILDEIEKSDNKNANDIFWSNKGFICAMAMLSESFKVIRHSRMIPIETYDNEDSLQLLVPYAKIAGEWFCLMADEEMDGFRAASGWQGQDDLSRKAREFLATNQNIDQVCLRQVVATM